VFCYLGALLYFPNSSWGLASGVKVFNLYGRGTGVLPLPLINITLYLLYFSTVFWKFRQQNFTNYFHIRYYFWAFNILFFLFLVYGFGTGVDFKNIFSQRGLINVVNMYLFMVILAKVISNQNTMDKLTYFIMFCALTRGIWGLVRWALLGGDPANIYAHAQKIAVRITFFDINDNLIATLGAFLAAWLLLYRKNQITFSRKLFYYSVIAVGLAVVFLSYRRTAWGGLIAAGLWLVWQQPWRRKIQVSLITAAIGSIVLPIVVADRFSHKIGSHGSGFFYDITSSKGKITASEGRFSELSYAWKYISEDPFTGILPWGGLGLDGKHDFVHSGFIHLWLKGGFFALFLFLLMLWSYFLFTRKVNRELPKIEIGLSETAFAGFLFSAPNILFGTPIIEFRTMQLMGVLFILPYIVYGISRNQPISNKVYRNANNQPMAAE
jgi:hypothetical protein